MSDLLGIGASGVYAYRNALAVTGDNVANAETAGYARRSVIIGESASSTGSSPFYGASLNFGGSNVTGVARAWDAFKAADARAASADSARADTRASWLGPVETALDDSDSGLGAKLSAFFNAGSALATDPTSATGRTQMLSALGAAADALKGAAAGLARTSAGIADAATAAVSDTNTNLAELARVNVAIRSTPDGSSARAALADQRDGLLDALSGTVGIDAKIAADGTATVTLAGNAQAVLVSGKDAAQLSLGIAGDGRLAFSIGSGDSARVIAPTGGALAGLADSAAMVAGSRASLDAVANDFTTKVNAWNAQGTTAAGTAGQPLLSTTGGAAGLALATADSDAIAAASADGTANGNLLALADLRGAGGPEAKLGVLVASNAQALASAKAQSAAASTRADAAVAARDDASGVDLDQEAAQLIRYQQAYDGSTKIIQAAQTTLQSILALF